MKTQTHNGMIYFIGAGPGHPDLITVKGKKLLAQADVIVYAGSLVQEEILQHAPATAQHHNSAGMNLDKQIEVMSQAAQAGKIVVRLHTGDPSIYGAIAEQMKALDKLDIPYTVVPGVSSALAAAAALKIELTIPDHTQTIILTRQSGRTKVPEREQLSKLAAHKSSLMIFLSAGMIEKVVDELITAGYQKDTPIAVVYRVTWPDQKIIKGTLANIATKLTAAEITHHALIVISPSLKPELSEEVPLSHLYGTGQVAEARDDRTAIIVLTRNGLETGKRLLSDTPNSLLYAPEKHLDNTPDNTNIISTNTSIRQTLQSAFERHSALICIMASGIVVRELAPLLKSKHADPAVVVIDEAGKFAFSLLSGHKGGANALAHQSAEILGGQAVITTASDTQGLPALDLLAEQNGWYMQPCQHLTALSGAMVNHETILIYQDCGSRNWLPTPLPDNFEIVPTLEALTTNPAHFAVCITYQDVHSTLKESGKKALVLHPPCLHMGIGCNRNTPADEIESAVTETLKQNSFSPHSIARVASIDIKADEPGLLSTAEQNHWPIKFFSAEELSTVENIPNPSEYAQKNVGAPGVAEPAAALSAQASAWLIEKQKYPNVTIAVTVQEEAK